MVVRGTCDSYDMSAAWFAYNPTISDGVFSRLTLCTKRGITRRIVQYRGKLHSFVRLLCGAPASVRRVFCSDVVDYAHRFTEAGRALPNVIFHTANQVRACISPT